ncbi:MAG: hypothetical protein COW84_05045 [Gammaproteobacteria bacterium CG22_combo_CG10-13_8_21_14_all_40_8]|nr:MAG: hypothetical protein COW84_05045 [Gammaproteobacteria bacterium CG22_combo_CG10-13_8_21_14_all_40_8]
MIAIPLQQPTPPVVFAQLPVQGIRSQNLLLRPVPQPSAVFESKPSQSTTTNPRPSEKANIPNVNISADAKSQSEVKPTSDNALGQRAVASDNSPQTNNVQDSPLPQTTQSKQQPENDSSKQQDSDAEKKQKEQGAQEKVEQAKKAQEQQVVQELSSRDREVRAHEQAHATVGGNLAGPPSFKFIRGPNGVLYATEGEVSISSGGGGSDPESNIAKLEKVIRAALAPAQPSGQDVRVATNAAAALNEIRSSLAAQKYEERTQRNSEGTNVLNGLAQNVNQSTPITNANRATSNISLEDSPFTKNLQNRLQKSGALALEQQTSSLRLSA